MKTQTIRLLDIFLLGPAMILGATKHVRQPLKSVLLIGGIATILYNGKNYLDIRAQEQAALPAEPLDTDV